MIDLPKIIYCRKPSMDRKKNLSTAHNYVEGNLKNVWKLLSSTNHVVNLSIGYLILIHHSLIKSQSGVINITSSKLIRSKKKRWHISIRFPHMERNLQEICTITRLITWLPCMGIEHGTSIPRQFSWSCRIQLNCTSWTLLIIMYSVADIKRNQIEPKQVELG